MKNPGVDYSRFAKTEKIILDGSETYGKWVEFSFLKQRPNDDDIGVFRVTSATAGRPDLIANAIYGTPLLDWVLISFNNARGALNWPKAGDSIEYPEERVVVPEVML